MAQTSLNFDPVSKQAYATAAERKQLELEKFGVMAGFLVGLLLAVGSANDFLAALEAPKWVSVAGGVLVVALATSAGLRLSTKLAKRLGWA